MRCRVASVTLSCPLSARDTEATETPAARATSLIVAVTLHPERKRIPAPRCKRLRKRLHREVFVGDCHAALQQDRAGQDRGTARTSMRRPGEAGTQLFSTARLQSWIPAFAGTNGRTTDGSVRTRG